MGKVFGFARVLGLGRLISNKKGQGLVEYGLIIAGVALICAAAVSIFGHKTSDLFAAVATILPGADPADEGPIVSGKLIETTSAANGPITVNAPAIAANSNQARLGRNVGLGSNAADFGGLVLEAE